VVSDHHFLIPRMWNQTQYSLNTEDLIINRDKAQKKVG